MKKILILNLILFCFCNFKLSSFEDGMPMEQQILPPPPPPMPAKQQAETQVGLPVSQEEFEIDKQKQRLEQLKIEVDNIEQQEETLMANLRELQNQIDQAKVKASNASQTNKQILNAQTVEQARGLLNQLNIILNQVQAIKTSLQNQFSANFNNTVFQIQNKIQLVQAKMNEIKNITAKIIHSQPEPAVIVERKIELQSPIAKKAVEAGAYIAAGFNWFKRLLTPDVPDITNSSENNVQVQVEDKISQIEALQKTSPQLPNVQIPVIEKQSQGISQTIPLTEDSLNEKLNKQMETYNKKIQQLKERKEKIKEEEMELERKQQLLNELKQQKDALKKYQELMSKLGLVVEQANAGDSKFRKNVEVVLGKVLDFGESFLDKFGNVSKGIYNKFFLPKLEGFIDAVKQKVDEEKQKKEDEEIIEQTTIFMPTTDSASNQINEVPPPPPPVMMDTTMQSTAKEPISVMPVPVDSQAMQPNSSIVSSPVSMP